MQKEKLEDLAAFIRENRSSEGNFEKLLAKMEDAATDNETKEVLKITLEDIRTKADEYRKAKETGSMAWPEFEKFVSEFEKAVMEARRATE
ncbi:MAG: hypothetical protein EON98_12255 [Chitinophagaceae bacterium]|nr:MAG: hypothetical protein EON98_12255 [Chitinophagaceae bacterium]